MSANIRDLNQAWDLYYHVFRRISRQLPQLTQLELQYVSPKLLMCRDLELAVPGSYTPVGAVNQIGQVEPSLQVKYNSNNNNNKKEDLAYYNAMLTYFPLCFRS